MQSLYEIETVVKRSARAKGLSWGMAEEIAKAVRILEQSLLPGLESFKRLVDLDLTSFNPIQNPLNDEKLTKICPIHFGVFFLDNLHNKQFQKQFSFLEIYEPLLLLPFLKRSANKNLLNIKFTSKEFNFNLSPGEIVSLSNQLFPHIATKITLDFSTSRSPQYSQSTWDELYELSLETFVEETEEKKLSGAGAGLTDND
jgi:hypothetical protein